MNSPSPARYKAVVTCSARVHGQQEAGEKGKVRTRLTPTITPQRIYTTRGVTKAPFDPSSINEKPDHVCQKPKPMIASCMQSQQGGTRGERRQLTPIKIWKMFWIGCPLTPGILPSFCALVFDSSLRATPRIDWTTTKMRRTSPVRCRY